MNLINAFHELAKINKVNLELKATMDPYQIYSQGPIIDRITKDWDLKMMLNFASSSNKNKTLMEPIIRKKKEELQSYVNWLNDLGDTYSLKKLDQMKTLSIFYKQITTVPNFNLPNLVYLFIRNNQITSIPDFNRLSNLQVLDLSNNQITSIPDFNLPELLALDLSRNQLTTIPDLNHLSKLQELYLSYNQLTEIQQLYLPNLEYIWLDHNPLTTAPIFGAESTPKLKKAWFDNDQLTAFLNVDLPNLQELYNENPQFTTISNFNLPNL